VGWVGAHHLVTVAWRHPERLDDGVQKRLDFGRCTTLDEVDIQQRHDFSRWWRAYARDVIDASRGTIGCELAVRRMFGQVMQ
jgi:hypothetical protein